MCSGDARCFECSEAFHMQMLEVRLRPSAGVLPSLIRFLQVAKEYSLLSMSPSSSKEATTTKWRSERAYLCYGARLTELARLLNSLYLLESYRVVLLQRPPNLYSVSIIADDLYEQSTSLPPEDVPSFGNAIRMLQLLLSPHKSFRGDKDILEANLGLTSLAALSWHTRPRHLSTNVLATLWERESVELALYRWMEEALARPGVLKPWMTMLFDMTFINLHAPVHQIHSLARAYVSNKVRKGDAFETLSKWRQGQDAVKAMFHANAVLRLGQSLTVLETTQAAAGTSTRRADFVEGTHMAACVYVAALTLWAAAFCQEGPHHPSNWSSVKTGIQVLWWMDVRAARMLSNVLEHIARDSNTPTEGGRPL